MPTTTFHLHVVCEKFIYFCDLNQRIGCVSFFCFQHSIDFYYWLYSFVRYTLELFFGWQQVVGGVCGRSCGWLVVLGAHNASNASSPQGVDHGKDVVYLNSQKLPHSPCIKNYCDLPLIPFTSATSFNHIYEIFNRHKENSFNQHIIFFFRFSISFPYLVGNNVDQL